MRYCLRLLFVRVAALISILFVGSCTLIWAGDTQIDGIQSLDRLWEEVDNWSVMTTIASKMEENASSAPSAVTVFTRRQIRNMGVSTLNELLNFVPGFQVTREIENGGQDFITARFTRTGLSNTVLILKDGIRLNNSHTGEAGLLTRMIHLYDVHQVEVIRGPGSALYGANAFIGIVNIITDEKAREGLIQIGEHGAREVSVIYNQEIGRWSYTLSGGFFDDKGERYEDLVDAVGYTSDTTDPRQGTHFNVKVKRGGLSLQTLFQERSSEDFYQFRQLGNGINEDKSSSLSWRLDYDLIAGNKHDLKIFANNVEWEWEARGLLNPMEVNGTFDMVGGPTIENFNREVGLDYQWEIKSGHIFTMGLSYRETGNKLAVARFNFNPVTGAAIGSLQQTGSFNNTHFVRNVVGTYVQDRFDLTNNLNMVMGLRYDNYNDFGSTLNPRAAMIYETSFQSTIKLMYGEGIRAPSLSELFNDSPISVGYANLEPEKIRTMELSYHHDFDLVNGSISYYENSISNIIETTPLTPDSSLPVTYVNGGTSVVKGLEVEAWLNLEKWFSARLAWSQALEGESPLAPRALGSFILNSDMERWNLNVNGIFRDTSAALPKQSAYWLIGGKLQYQVGSSFTLHCSASNLFNEQYNTPVLSLANGVPERGRQFFVGLSYTGR